MHKRFPCIKAVLVCTMVVAVAACFAWANDEPDPEPMIREVRVASPRAALVMAVCDNTPQKPTEISAVQPVPHQVGAAENFASKPIALVVPKGQVIYFRDSRDIEGVWYRRTHGWLASAFFLQIKDPTGTEDTWIPIGHDGAYAIRKGPSVGRANIGVRHRFERPGQFVLRAIVVTVAVPVDPNNADPNQKCPYTAFDYDEVLIRVQVVEEVTPELEGLEVLPAVGTVVPLEPLFGEQ